MSVLIVLNCWWRIVTLAFGEAIAHLGAGGRAAIQSRLVGTRGLGCVAVDWDGSHSRGPVISSVLQQVLSANTVRSDKARPEQRRCKD